MPLYPAMSFSDFCLYCKIKYNYSSAYDMWLDFITGYSTIQSPIKVKQ